MESNNDGRIDDEDTAARHVDCGAVVNEGTARNNENDVAANGDANEDAAEDYKSTTATSTTNSNADDEEDASSITIHRADGAQVEGDEEEEEDNNDEEGEEAGFLELLMGQVLQRFEQENGRMPDATELKALEAAITEKLGGMQ